MAFYSPFERVSGKKKKPTQEADLTTIRFGRTVIHNKLPICKLFPVTL